MTRPALPPAVHGARDYKELARLGLDPNHIIDFSANSNPYGPHPTVLEAVRQAVTGPTLARYPDRDCLTLRYAIAAAEGVSPENILPTNGASELIQLIALAFVSPGSRHLILAPTFGEYSRAIQLAGGMLLEHRPAAANLRFETNLAANAIKNYQSDSIWLCNPNNPTGQRWTAEQLAQLRAAAPQVLWVIDESYRYFSKQMLALSLSNGPVVSSQEKSNKSVESGGQRSAVSRHQLALLAKNAIIIRSLTKAHGLAGLRLGYAIAEPETIEALRAIQPPWSVNSLAQVAGVAALQPQVLHWRGETLAQLHHHAADLWQRLSALNFTVLPTDTTYALVHTGDAAAFRHRLLKQGLLVRDCASFGLPGYVRIAAQLPEENEQLLKGIKHL